ncbi:amidase domain-containing protein [Clostridium sp.]|uniref:amidase domain-containing protein n=1 Tax=Clostridium sp. TaxID=1506 RepID=UPI002632A4B0|nr:amidase domain-containing protein [Clostridium sp.]
MKLKKDNIVKRKFKNKYETSEDNKGIIKNILGNKMIRVYYRVIKRGLKRINKFSISKDKRYKGEKAAKWALENVYEEPDYSSDCSNFVSKSLHHGGIPRDGVWYPGSNTWVRVIELRNWLVYKGYAEEYKDISNADVGDVIQLYRSGFKDKWGWQHSLIVTEVDSKGRIFVSARTRPALNVSILQYYPGPNWANIRLLKINKD